MSLLSLEKVKNDPICGYFCSRGTLRVPARNTIYIQNDPIVGHFEAKILLVGFKIPEYFDGMDGTFGSIQL